ncbi:hypothetical protein [Nonomuraea wenchangensis]|uniref:hypothetical protein n=1 Tax=Nonomuraea wenchangensis TaxID=568860 RepID=UPI0033221AB8
MRRVATRAGELGYHEQYRSVHDPLITLAYLAGVTSSVRLGVEFYRISPARRRASPAAQHPAGPIDTDANPADEPPPRSTA